MIGGLIQYAFISVYVGSPLTPYLLVQSASQVNSAVLGLVLDVAVVARDPQGPARAFI